MLIFYFIGVVVSWIILKFVRVHDKDNTWQGVWISFFYSLLSWFGLGGIVAITLAHFIPDKTWNKLSNFVTKLFKNQPPKWL